MPGITTGGDVTLVEGGLTLPVVRGLLLAADAEPLEAGSRPLFGLDAVLEGGIAVADG